MKKIDVFLANWDVIKIVSPNEISEQPIYVINDDEIYAECFYKDYHYYIIEQLRVHQLHEIDEGSSVWFLVSFLYSD